MAAILRMLLYLFSYFDFWSWFQKASTAWSLPSRNQEVEDVLVSARYVDENMGLDACVAKRVRAYLRSSSNTFIDVADLFQDLQDVTDEGTLILRCKAGPGEFEVEDPCQIDLEDLRDRVRLWNEISEAKTA